MPTLYTIGYKGRSLAEFIGSLQTAEADAVIDIRLRNTSHLAGYSKKETLSFLLREGFGIAYEHIPALAPTNEIFQAYRENQDWHLYEASFASLLQERHAEQFGQALLSQYWAPCLLCAEPTATHCHRRLVAEYWSHFLPNLKIQHL